MSRTEPFVDFDLKPFHLRQNLPAAPTEGGKAGCYDADRTEDRIRVCRRRKPRRDPGRHAARAVIRRNTPNFVIGASVGAINAAYFAGAPNADGVERLAEIWSGLRRGDVFPFTFAGAFGLLRHPDSIVDSGRLRHLIETNLAYARLEDVAIPVHVTATSLEGMAVLLSKRPIDAILASAAIPGIFPPVRIDGQPLMDDAIANNTPILDARASERHGSSCFQLELLAP